MCVFVEVFESLFDVVIVLTAGDRHITLPGILSFGQYPSPLPHTQHRHMHTDCRRRKPN